MRNTSHALKCEEKIGLNYRIRNWIEEKLKFFLLTFKVFSFQIAKKTYERNLFLSLKNAIFPKKTNKQITKFIEHGKWGLCPRPTTQPTCYTTQPTAPKTTDHDVFMDIVSAVMC